MSAYREEPRVKREEVKGTFGGSRMVRKWVVSLDGAEVWRSAGTSRWDAAEAFGVEAGLVIALGKVT